MEWELTVNYTYNWKSEEQLRTATPTIYNTDRHKQQLWFVIEKKKWQMIAMVDCTWDNCNSRVLRKVSLGRRRQEVNLISPFRLSYYCGIHYVVVIDLFPSTINCTYCITGWLQTIMMTDDDRRVRFHDNYSSGVMKIKRKALSLHHYFFG